MTPRHSRRLSIGIAAVGLCALGLGALSSCAPAITVDDGTAPANQTPAAAELDCDTVLTFEEGSSDPATTTFDRHATLDLLAGPFVTTPDCTESRSTAGGSSTYVTTTSNFFGADRSDAEAYFEKLKAVTGTGQVTSYIGEEGAEESITWQADYQGVSWDVTWTDDFFAEKNSFMPTGNQLRPYVTIGTFTS